jgi:subtilisin family serine protease
MASLKQDELPKFIEAGEFYDNYYSHGTHVADLALDGNPSARLLVVRYDSPAWHTIPPPFTPDVAEHFARNVARVARYLRDAHVRVVNLSWGDSVEMIESTLEANGTGGTDAQRRSIAKRSFELEADALTAAIAASPNILFVAGAGNTGNDLAVSRFVPADINLPNVLAVGAVDGKGAATDFTSYGDRVRIYASGVDVDARVPGGSHQRKTGTSVATPQVTNVAAKLIAINPDLSPAEVVKIISNSAFLSSDRKRRLLDPEAALACVQSGPIDHKP